ncbi:phage tail protein [Pseudaestuariivita rosea]|uniref:phage tail protein n=1 Tax=Pseudaestuariivita rosea TaxID=2763263 RepID=UPI001ABB1D19|nr:phage tail protein [Pseudaestuariivita rosea]
MALVFAPPVQPTIEGYEERYETSTRRAEFEGGYSQRSTTGPNALRQTAALVWDLAEPDKDVIARFLAARRGAEAFLYQLPWQSTARLWTCAAWTQAPIGWRGTTPFWRLRATFRQEFDIL